MKGILEDCRHALRIYRRTPAASALLVAALAIAIAFVTAFLSLYSDLIMRPEPGFQKGGRIVSVGWSDGKSSVGLPLELYERLNGGTATLESVAGTIPQSFGVGPEKEQMLTELVTRQFFSGVRPKLALGEGFKDTDHEEDSEPVAVISWRYWQDQFAARPDILGRTIQISLPPAPTPPAELRITQPPEQPPLAFRIIGVMDRSFSGTMSSQSQSETTLWIPVERALSMMMPGMPANLRPSRLSSSITRGIGRLARGASVAAAAQELNSRFADEQFSKLPGIRFEVVDGIRQSGSVRRETQRQLRLFLSGSVLLAFVAAANVSLFLLARAPSRRRELGTRLAVGARLTRLSRQLISEAAVLVIAAAVLGLLLSISLARFLRGLPFLRQAQWHEVTLLDWRVLGLVAIVLALVTMTVSLAPIAGLKNLGIAATSRLVAARATASQRIAGAAQIAVASTLAGAAIAFGWHLTLMLIADPGYRTKGRYVVPYLMTAQGRPLNMMMRDGKLTVLDNIDNARRHETFEAIPGVATVSLSSAVPGLAGSVDRLAVPDPLDPRQAVQVRAMVIDNRYVDLLGLKLVYGQNVSAKDPGGVLVNQTFARRFFGREDATGELLPELSSDHQTRAPALAGATHIVGILRDLSYYHPLDTIDPMIFTPSGFSFAGLAIIESDLPAPVLHRQVQEALARLELKTLGNVESLSHIRDVNLGPDRARALLTISTAAIVLLMAALGFYGTQRYLVMAGRREYAIRASLGAGPRALYRLVLRRGLMLGVPGLVVGIPLAFILVAWLRDDYVSRAVQPAVVTISVVLTLIALILLATIGPAQLARRTRPAMLLRED